MYTHTYVHTWYMYKEYIHVPTNVHIYTDSTCTSIQSAYVQSLKWAWQRSFEGSNLALNVQQMIEGLNI